MRFNLLLTASLSHCPPNLAKKTMKSVALCAIVLLLASVCKIMSLTSIVWQF